MALSSTSAFWEDVVGSEPVPDRMFGRAESTVEAPQPLADWMRNLTSLVEYLGAVLIGFSPRIWVNKGKITSPKVGA